MSKLLEHYCDLMVASRTRLTHKSAALSGRREQRRG